MVEQIGKHRVMHSDIMFGNIEELMRGETVDVMYSDPPWGQGNLTYWQTMNKKMTGSTPNTINYAGFLNRIFTIAGKKVNKHLFVEYGKAWGDDIIRLAEENGFRHVTTIELLYRSGSKMLPLDLHVFTKTQLTITPEHRARILHSYGYKTLQEVLTPLVKQGDKILDPCCGMGYTAQIAIDTGMTFFGNELNSARLEKTKNRLRKASKKQ